MTISQTEAAEEREVVSITGREIVERLARLEEGQKGLESRIVDLRQLVLWGFGVTFAGIFALIGFVIWDRRTAIAPAVRGVEDLQDRQQRIEKALRELSRDNPKLAESLRNLGLL